MLGLKVPRKEGEKARRKLAEEGLLLTNYKIKSTSEFLILPVKKRLEGEMVEEEFEKLPSKRPSLREIVGGLRAYDVIGDIAIVEIPDSMAEKRRLVGETLLSLNKKVKCVFEKRGEVSGVHRTRKLVHLAGEKRTETIHREYGCSFSLDIEKVFFSPRLATERKRIAGMVGDGEKVFDMFCGVGPFSIIISKYSGAKEIHASDINEYAIAYLKKNIQLNRVKNVVPYRGDALKISHSVGNVDRCIMNLPTQSFQFLDVAALHAHFIHLYCLSENLIKVVENIEGMEIGVLSSRKVKEYSPHEAIYCLDLENSAAPLSDQWDSKAY